MLTILGAGGAVGNQLVKLLAAKNRPFRLVGRNPRATPSATETVAADVTDRDQTVRAVAGSDVVHLLVGLKYDRRVWQDMSSTRSSSAPTPIRRWWKTYHSPSDTRTLNRSGDPKT